MFSSLCSMLNLEKDCLDYLDCEYLKLTNNEITNKLFTTATNNLLLCNRVEYESAFYRLLNTTSVNEYALNLLLVVSTLKDLSIEYEKANKLDSFNGYVNNVKSQVIECKNKFGVWGLKCGFWQWLFHELNCSILGRLSFEPAHHFCDISYKGVKKGDPVILIHIPTGKPLDEESVKDSLKQAYSKFKGGFKGEIVPFITHSWLIYPPFIKCVFKDGGNLQKFAKLFNIISENKAGYENFPEVFGIEYNGCDFDSLPQNTSLQKNMVDYLKKGNEMGEGYGIFFYNENGII